MSSSVEAVVTKPTRAQWVVSQALVGTIRAVNPMFCGVEGDEPPAAQEGFSEAVAAIVAAECSVMQIEDVIGLLDRAIEIAEEKKISQKGLTAQDESVNIKA